LENTKAIASAQPAIPFIPPALPTALGGAVSPQANAPSPALLDLIQGAQQQKQPLVVQFQGTGGPKDEGEANQQAGLLVNGLRNQGVNI
jgi:hypothetical protein